ncbi:MAG: glycoside hydrolase family 3 protein, partial [Vulcanimicrobiota bacterium]
EKAGIAGCAKHFPGHGDTSFDSHLALAAVNVNMERIQEVELPPFQAAIKAGVPCIMTAHVIFSAIERELPATLSRKVLTGLLRLKMGFDGLIITDSMSMKAIADHFGLGEAVVMAVQAGADIVMMCGSHTEQLVTYESLLEGAKTGRISEETINTAVYRILKFKDKYVVNPPALKNLPEGQKTETINDAARKAVSILYGNINLIPVTDDSRVLVISPDKLYKTLLDEKIDKWSIHPYLEKKMEQVIKISYACERPGEILNIVKPESNYDYVFLEVYTRGAMKNEQREELESVIGEFKKRKIPVILVSLSSFYGIPQNADLAISAFDYNPPSLAAIVRKITE